MLFNPIYPNTVISTCTHIEILYILFFTPSLQNPVCYLLKGRPGSDQQTQALTSVLDSVDIDSKFYTSTEKG